MNETSGVPDALVSMPNRDDRTILRNDCIDVEVLIELACKRACICLDLLARRLVQKHLVRFA